MIGVQPPERPPMKPHLLSLVFVLGGSVALASEAPFSLPKLTYEAGALEPTIDAETMTVHHDKHHRDYVDALNNAVANDPKMEGVTLAALLSGASKLQQSIRDAAGGHYNHSFFWTILAPKGTGGEPSAALAARIDEDFGSFEKFRTKFENAGVKRTGSGWVWLVWSGSKLMVTSTRNQDNPLMDDAEVQGSPLLANDLWEHAYYLKHQGRNGEYLAGWWTVVNWKEVNSRFAEASAAK